MSVERVECKIAGQVSRDHVKPGPNTPIEMQSTRLVKLHSQWKWASDEKTEVTAEAERRGCKISDLPEDLQEQYVSSAERIQAMELAALQGLLFNKNFREDFWKCVSNSDDFSFGGWGARLTTEAAIIAALVTKNREAIIGLPSVFARRVKKTNFYLHTKHTITPVIALKARNEKYWVFHPRGIPIVFPGYPYFHHRVSGDVAKQYELSKSLHKEKRHTAPVVIAVPWENVRMNREGIGLVVPNAVSEIGV